MHKNIPRFGVEDHGVEFRASRISMKKIDPLRWKDVLTLNNTLDFI